MKSNPIQELKEIIGNQKSIRTGRLGVLLKEVEQIYIKQGYAMRRKDRELKALRDKLNGLHGSKQHDKSKREIIQSD